MKFQDYVYARPDMNRFELEFAELLEQFSQAESFEDQNAVMQHINDARNQVESMMQIAKIRYTINTDDPFYKAEQDYYDETLPKYQGMVSKYYEALVASRFRSSLEAVWGSQLFALAEQELKTFAPEIVQDLQQENKKSSEYVKLVASAKIMFRGEERTLSQLAPFQQSLDREIRKQAADAKYSFYEEIESKVDSIYDELVRLRTEMARKLGYRNFIELAYARLNRTDYGPEQAAAFRRQVLEHIVPAAVKLNDRRRRRLGLDSLRYYDAISFATGNPTPKGNPEWIVGQAERMYAEMSKETDEFFRFMLDGNLMDLISKPGKRVGGYCAFIGTYKAPFIFSNFNGTAHDVDVLTHEAGHAFQAYLSRDFAVPEYIHPTLDACEIHSMSMEFFAWPWIDSFFKEDADKYRFSHLSGAISFIPYGVAVDEFQHFVYEHPEATPAERKAEWRRIERLYVPSRVYDDMPFLERGCFWHQQQHIFKSPFYYIDYTLAQICALQYWQKAEVDRTAAWDSYVKLCGAGGSRSFISLVELAGLRSPFNEGCVDSVIGDIEAWLDQIDDTQL